MGSRSRRSRSTGRGGSNWKRAALVRSSSSSSGGGGGGIRAEAAQILAFRQDTRGPASSLFPFPPAFIELLAPSLNSYHAPPFAKRKKLDRFLFCRARARSPAPAIERATASSRARPPWKDRSIEQRFLACIFERNELSRLSFSTRFLSRAVIRVSDETRFFLSKRFSTRSAFPRATLHGQHSSGRLINRA